LFALPYSRALLIMRLAFDSLSHMVVLTEGHVERFNKER
jgi:hypothetical protein